MRTIDHTPHARRFWDPPTTTSPSAAKCCTPCRKFVKRGPRHFLLNFLETRTSNSAVKSMTSLGLGVTESDCDFSIRYVDFCSLDSSASSSDTACARRISAFNRDAFARALDVTIVPELREEVEPWLCSGVPCVVSDGAEKEASGSQCL